MKRKSNNSHITLEARLFIEESLNERLSITEIANKLSRNKSSILREIKRHITYVYPSSFNNKYPCLKKDTCKVKNFNCYENCKNIEIDLCPRLIPSPHTCNGCNHKNGCRYVKMYYKAKEANSEYLNSWSEDRTGLRYTDEEQKVLDNTFYNLVINNRSIFHSLVIINNKGFDFKESNIYRQIKNDKLRLKYSDLPRNRKKKRGQVDNNYKKPELVEGHTYEDYISYKEKNPNDIEMQMDTVLGLADGNEPVILTLEIVKISFMFIFKLEKKTFDNTLIKLQEFQSFLGQDTFNKIFKILLTDNGSEFRSISKITETFSEINIFYCHPYASYEKGALENNHEFLRRVIPKGISLKQYSQKDYNLLSSHINSLYRKKLNGKCPFDLIEKYVSKELLEKIGLSHIEDTKVNLTPFLLGEKNIENIKKYLSYEDIKKANISLTKGEEKNE